MKSSTIDAILSAWENENETLPYSKIKKHIVAKQIIKETNDSSLSRWLKKLVKDEYLEKTEDGYIMKMKPKDYQVFDYINELRQKYGKYIYEGEVGGWISHVCASAYLNFDETLIMEADEKIAFNIISVRLGELFGALYFLKNNILKRRCGLTKLKLDDSVMREALFAFLNRSIGEHHATEELVEKYYSDLEPVEKKYFDKLWEKNKPKFDTDRIDLLSYDIFSDRIEEDPESYKKSLKQEFSFDVEKYTVEELVDKYDEINKWIEKNHKQEKQELEEFTSFALTPEEQELEYTYRTAISVKITECIKALDTNTEDFAIILTRHPRTMNKYYTPEHILHEAMEWAREPPKDEFLKDVWYKILDEEKTFEGIVADRLSSFNSINPKIIESLKSRPWVKKELSKYGSFSEILRLYKIKLKKRLKQDAEDEKRIFKMIEKFGKVSKDTKHEEP